METQVFTELRRGLRCSWERWEIAKESRGPARHSGGVKTITRLVRTLHQCTWVTSGCPSPLIEDRWSPPGVQLLWVSVTFPPPPSNHLTGGGGDWPTISLSGHWGRLHCYIKILTAIVRGMDHIEHILHSQGSPAGQAIQTKFSSPRQSVRHIPTTSGPLSLLLIIISSQTGTCIHFESRQHQTASWWET